MKIKKRWILIILLFLSMGMCSIPELRYRNSGISESIGSVRNGELKNGWLIPYSGNNYHYFSQFSYYILNSAYVHSGVYKTIMDAYKACETTCPGREFILMECTRRKGGRMLLHWSHQNGKSVDFMVPKKKGGSQKSWANNIGLAHYLLKFNEDGKLVPGLKTEIDFEAMAQHLIAIDDAAQQNGLRIRKILFHTDLHDNLFNSPSGQLLAQRDINFIPHLNEFINILHDDHYHIDFEFLEEVD